MKNSLLLSLVLVVLVGCDPPAKTADEARKTRTTVDDEPDDDQYVAELMMEVNRARMELMQAQELSLQSEEQRAELRSLEQNLAKYVQILPSPEVASEEQMIRLLQAKAQRTGAQVQSYRTVPDKTKQKHAFRSVSLSVELQGTWEQVVQLLNALESHETFLRVSAFRIDSGERPADPLTCQLTIDTFRYDPTPEAESDTRPRMALEDDPEDQVASAPILNRIRREKPRLGKKGKRLVITLTGILKQLEEANEGLRDVGRLEDAIARAKARQATIILISQSKVLWSLELQQLAGIMKDFPGVWMKQLLASSKSLSLSCSAKGQQLETVARFREALKADPNFFHHFDSLKSSEVMIAEERMDFTLTLNRKREKQERAKGRPWKKKKKKR